MFVLEISNIFIPGYVIVNRSLYICLTHITTSYLSDTYRNVYFPGYFLVNYSCNSFRLLSFSIQPFVVIDISRAHCLVSHVLAVDPRRDNE